MQNSSFSFSVKVSPSADSRSVQLNRTYFSCPLGVFQALDPGRIVRKEHTTKIVVDDSIEKDFRSFLETGRLEITANNLEPVTYAANVNKFDGLLRACEDVYLTHLCDSTCLRLWILGSDHGCKRLTKQALRLVQDSFEDMVAQDTFCHLDKHRVKELIEDPFINVTSLNTIHNVIVRWGNYDSGSRHCARQELLAYFQNIVSASNHFYVSLQEMSNNNQPRVRRVSSSDSDSTYPDFFDSTDVCYRGVCYKPFDKELSVFEVTNENGNLLVNLIDTPWPKELYSDSTFSYSPENGCIYGTQRNKVWCRRPDANFWEELPKLPMKEQSHQSVYFSKGLLFALGGYDFQMTNPTHRIFTCKKGKWAREIKGQKLELEKGVHSCQCVSVGSFIYIFGVSHCTKEEKTTKIQSLQRIDTSNPGPACLLPTPAYAKDGIFANCVAPSPNGQLYVVSSRGDVLEYNPVDNSYRTLPPMPTPRCSFGAFVSEDRLFVFGGETKTTSANFDMQSYCLELLSTSSAWYPCGVKSKPVSVLS